MTWLFPLNPRHRPAVFPYPEGHDGAFSTKRRFDIHTGVDLYCTVGDEVRACEGGRVVGSFLFTGPKAQSPWWNDTYCVLVEGPSGVICYGEVCTDRYIGDEVWAGDHIGSVLQVRKTARGKPMTMLHLELYCKGTRDVVWWHHDQPQPSELRDPTEWLATSVIYL